MLALVIIDIVTAVDDLKTENTYWRASLVGPELSTRNRIVPVLLYCLRLKSLWRDVSLYTLS
jgi:hypothetical protein